MSATLEAGDTQAPSPAPAPERRRGRERPFQVVAVLAALALVGFVAYVVTNGSHPPARPAAFPAAHPTSLPTGTTAPGFTLPRLGGGAPVSLATAHGEPVMVNFFASWCSNCRAELHAVASAAAAVAGKVAVIGIDTAENSTTTARRLLSGAGAAYPVGVDPSGAVATHYKITGLPVTYFLSPRGTVMGVAWGAQTKASLLRWAAKLTVAGS